MGVSLWARYPCRAVAQHESPRRGEDESIVNLQYFSSKIISFCQGVALTRQRFQTYRRLEPTLVHFGVLMGGRRRGGGKRRGGEEERRRGPGRLPAASPRPSRTIPVVGIASLALPSSRPHLDTSTFTYLAATPEEPPSKFRTDCSSVQIPTRGRRVDAATLLLYTTGFADDENVLLARACGRT